jgi:GNAT superfamily N-acetyltransferase
MEIRIAVRDDEILACFPVLQQLRPQLRREELVARVRRQEGEGYRLAYLAVDGVAAAVAGFRIANCLAWGKFLYVDDLVTDESRRSRGHGERLFEWLVERAREAGCGELHLDSGVQRFAAHRFYLLHRMAISSLHFSMPIV